MYSGDLNIKRIPLKVFYDQSILRNSDKLPSEKRNIDIIRGIKFGKLLQHINDKKKEYVYSWLHNNKTKLNEYLEKKKNNLEENELVKHCKHLNYILDFVVQAVNKFDRYKFFQPSHEFDKNSIHILNSYKSLNCQRNLFDLKDKNLYIKKIMYDLFDDIEYMLSDQTIVSSKQCSKMVGRIKYRRGILGEIYVAVRDNSIFNFDESCTLSIIDKKLKAIECNRVSTPPQTVALTDSQPANPVPSHGSDSLESGETEDGEETMDLEDQEFSLPVNEDPPKLDTTYAAASLAGISLFGTILYKYGPFRNRLNSLRGAMNGSNIFPLDNNIYDANRMNNFEYLQTGIPNGEYQVGYASVTDY
ncbi:VIR protein [Plasmodium vivax]|uniref:VIR protein n=1 Tax=Plasmodium vivax TaxID=5855 RepID=A0A1G4E951_PLAVI|nr:VIR protein [Plasmodium vivax]